MDGDSNKKEEDESNDDMSKAEKVGSTFLQNEILKYVSKKFEIILLAHIFQWIMR